MNSANSDFTEEYCHAFSEVEVALADDLLHLPHKASTSAIIVKLDEYLLKVPSPSLFHQILRSQKRRSIWDAFLHERQAAQAAMPVFGSCTVGTVPRFLNSDAIYRILRSSGIGKRSAEAIAPVVLCYKFFVGDPLGRFDEISSSYVYDRKVVLLHGPALVTGLERLAATVKSMNDQGVFHNDLAPQNIIVGHSDQNGPRFSIIDFGAAYLDYATTWEQPAIDFIDKWYAGKLGLPELELRKHYIELRQQGISKDCSDISRHANAVKILFVNSLNNTRSSEVCM